MKKLIYVFSIPTLLLVAGLAKAETYSTSTLATTFTSLIGGIVNDLISFIVSIFTNNISIVIMLSVGIGIFFWIVYKVRSAGTGR